MSVEGAEHDSPHLPAVPLAPLQSDDPAELGQFRLLGRLGTGGMGIAYLASGPDQKWIVVKRIWPHLSADGSFRSRLTRELDVMRSINSASTAALVDWSDEGGDAWFAMEFIPGVTLNRRVEEAGPLSSQDTEEFARQFLNVLSDVHAAGVIHRDLKPSNIMLSPTGPRLIDFGIANLDGVTQVTKTGSIVGSNGWLAPEQVRGDASTAATDVHAWALCVLFAATGSRPFGADNTAAAIYRVLEYTPDVPEFLAPNLGQALRAALSKDPLARPTVAQLQAQLGSPTAVAASPSPPRIETPHYPPPQPQQFMDAPARQDSVPEFADSPSNDGPEALGDSPIRWGSFWVTFWISLVLIAVLPLAFVDLTNQWDQTLLVPVPAAVAFLIGFRPSEFRRVVGSPLTYLGIVTMFFYLLSTMYSIWNTSPDVPNVFIFFGVTLLGSLWLLPTVWVGLLAKRAGKNPIPSIAVGLIPVVGPLVAFFFTAPTTRQKQVYGITVGTIVGFFLFVALLGAALM